MKRIITLFLILPIFNTIFGQSIGSKDSLNQVNLFNKFKPEYEKYEKQHGKYIKTDNTKMHYLEWGNDAHPTLVWIHGTYSNAYELYEIIDQLVKMNLHVVAIDYYGHGNTAIPNKDVSIYHVADDIKFLLDKMKIRKAIIGGWSRGGSITTAFYDTYPDMVQALILEDGGSVAWDIHAKSSEITKDIEETKQYYKSKKTLVFDTEFEAYWYMYNNWGIKGKENESLKKEIFTSYARIKKNATGKYEINPGAEELTGENTAEQNIAIIYTPFTAKHSFGATTHQLNPKIIYRNLNKPLLIFDPISKNDWFDFKNENTELAQTHQPYITHKIYEETWHGVKDEKPSEVVKDIKTFLTQNKLIP
ncbi:alpha/beta fold hydrolase [Chryseobacterium shigense]|uniref:Pimeloyl-ACP methyl ester carboxylesterase n=1 Tax=Chryseobacterium shigense TaxID=297244 RepID=A0A841NHA1_9FLAO|nr:alpha/beta hydrolase [Chryseobacterium shigense]MBB6371402.1 pimeloyl-ACP methyl ester carboxylesterase [Chryseobacterium shigense]